MRCSSVARRRVEECRSQIGGITSVVLKKCAYLYGQDKVWIYIELVTSDK